MAADPKVSIIIPYKSLDDYTIECITNCKKLDYPNFEILLLPDQPHALIEGTKVIPTGIVSPGLKRNIGVKNSDSEYCAFIDNDAYPRSDWLTNALKHLEDPQVGGVGGPGLTPSNDSDSQKAGGFVMSSFMMGNLTSRYKVNQSFESDDIHSCNFIARKSVLLDAGGWNEKYWPGEDTLMCLSIKKTGKKLLEASDVVVFHHRRSLLKAHLKQVSRFGEHRGFFVKKYPQNSLKPTFFLPTLLVLGLIIGVILSFVIPYFAYVTLSAVILYLVASLAAAVTQVKKPSIVLLVWMGIIVTHIFYGVAFLSGMLKRDLKR